jgi:hypothetical protein
MFIVNSCISSGITLRGSRNPTTVLSNFHVDIQIFEILNRNRRKKKPEKMLDHFF